MDNIMGESDRSQRLQPLWGGSAIVFIGEPCLGRSVVAGGCMGVGHGTAGVSTRELGAALPMKKNRDPENRRIKKMSLFIMQNSCSSLCLFRVIKR
jgi:hypothetical protein